jgi:hypothetical protein
MWEMYGAASRLCQKVDFGISSVEIVPFVSVIFGINRIAPLLLSVCVAFSHI